MAESYYIDQKGYVRSTLSVKDAALALRTSSENVYALIRLGLIRTLQLNSNQTIPLTEISNFIGDNMGKNLQQVVDEEKKRKKLQEKVRIYSLKEG